MSMLPLSPCEHWWFVVPESRSYWPYGLLTVGWCESAIISLAGCLTPTHHISLIGVWCREDCPQVINRLVLERVCVVSRLCHTLLMRETLAQLIHSIAV